KVTTKNHATPYDLADEIVTELHDDSQFQYTTNVLGQCDRSSSIVECFAQYRKGYCEHYASTMAILLRADGIPTRLVEGFLPGQIDVATGRETITTGGAHAWSRSTSRASAGTASTRPAAAGPTPSRSRSAPRGRSRPPSPCRRSRSGAVTDATSPTRSAAAARSPAWARGTGTGARRPGRSSRSRSP
ncbi:MAG TPA: transglutaminase domain-containing protein, partial [Verrucomicrobiae bacterium]|nr:transglutaminase domain-containing protein [Verrucomicrobiae bacterium]